MTRALRWLCHALLVRPFVHLVLGLGVRHRDRLPLRGPVVVVANHNTHVDTLVLMSLFPMRDVLRMRAAAAADHFLPDPVLAWISLNVFGIIPIKRRDYVRGDGDPLVECSAALERGEILILYPEGTRGEPERMQPFRTGIAHLARRHPEVPVVPVFLHGLGKFLPRGAVVPVPFQCDALIGEPLRWSGDRFGFMRALDERMAGLASEHGIPAWT